MRRWSRHTCSSTLLLVLLLTIPAFAQQAEPDLRQEIEALKQGQQAIQRELQAIKQLLQAQQARQPRRPAAPDVSGVSFDLRDRPVKGEPTARLALIEFTDYQ